MTLKPWREVAIPHADVLKGEVQQAEFAADLARVHAGTATPEYQQAPLFFQRTFITEGMRLLMLSLVKRLTGRGGDPVIQLQTAFGGGKTHTMLAVYHLASGRVPASDMPGVSAILDAAGITELPRARVVVLDGIKSSPSQPITHDGVTLRTLWGDLAWQLGGAEGYAMVADADASGTSPGKAVLEAVLARYAPCVILIDELVAYIRQFEEGKSLTGGTFDSNLSFVQALTEALKAVPTAVMLASLPESDREAGSQRGVSALAALSHYFGRVQALWKPVATEEAFEIVRRRLFAEVRDPAAAAVVCREFADYYVQNKKHLPRETQEARYYERMLNAYPIHPEVFDRLYEDWSSLDNFQRTRGVLKLMAKVIHRLWKDDNRDALIMPGSLPVYDPETSNDIIYYLPPGWDPVLDRDIDGERAETTSIESADTRFGAVQACRRAARTIFLGSAPSTANQGVRGLEPERVLLGAALPGHEISIFGDALKRLGDRLHYLNAGNNRFWFDTRPNLRREMEGRRGRFQEREDLYPVIQDRVRKSLASGLFGGIHVFTGSADVPDDWALRLVVLPPDAGFARVGENRAVTRAAEILTRRGDAPRQKQNRLIFLAPEHDTLQRLRDQVRTMLAWQSIVSDIRDAKLNLDMNQANQAQQRLDETNEALRRMVRETYKWLLAPVQVARPGKPPTDVQWEHFAINPGAANASQEIERVMKENELLITEWAPIHLAGVLKDWFWKEGAPEANALDVWQKTCQYLYLPRLKDDQVYQLTVGAGVESQDFFGVAQGKADDRYQGFVFGKRSSIILDSSLLLIEPAAAHAFAERVKAEQEAARPPAPGSDVPGSPPSGGGALVGGERTPPWSRGGTPTGGAAVPPSPATSTAKRRFYGTVDLNPTLAKKQFADLVDEVVEQFSAKLGVQVRISIEIEAQSAAGFDDALQRAVNENCRVLKVRGEFEAGD